MTVETLTKCGMGGLLLASVPAAPDPALWAQWGLAGLVVGYTLMRDRERERRMSQAIEAHHEWVRTTMVQALERNSVALEMLAGGRRRDDPHAI